MTAVEVVDEQTGEITEALDAAAARDLVSAIRVNLEDAADLIEQLWSGRGWVALGYGSWDALVTAEIRGCVPKLDRAERREAVAKLASTGMSTRAIGSALGVSRDTVQKDIAATGRNLPVGTDAPSLPEKVTGLDGRERTRKATPAEPEPFAAKHDALDPEGAAATKLHGWRQSVREALVKSHAMTRLFTPEELAVKAGDELLAEVLRRGHEMAEYMARVERAVALNTPGNVIRMERTR